MDTQGRGRARGRARGQTQETTGAGPMRRPGQGPGQGRGEAMSRPPQTGVQAPRPQPVAAPAPSAWGPSGRATHRGGASRETAPGGDVAAAAAQMQQMKIKDHGSGTGSVGSGSVSGSGVSLRGDGAAGGNGAPVGRGAMRGKRNIQAEIIRTRPETLASKKGPPAQGDQPVNLFANYFKLETVTDWCLYQYRVDFAPEEDLTGVRKGLLRTHREVLGGYIFDGSMMFTSRRLNPDPMTLTSERQSDGQRVTITVRLVGDLARGDYHYLQFFNILMRKCLDTLKLQLVGRDYYDAAAKVEIREFALELWPGYKTSIRQHESDILMCAEVTHKVMRRDTVYDVLDGIYRKSRGGDWQAELIRTVVGCVVLTDYNNKTYRVDDIDFTCNPQSTFKTKTEEISYSTYYKKRYNIEIRDKSQPMLVSRAKARDVRAGMAETIVLIPELCRMTGLTDDMRADFRLMQALAIHTRVAPEKRIEKLLSFSNRLRSNEQCNNDFREWNMKLAANLVQVPGKVLKQEDIIFGGGKRQSSGPAIEWANAFRNCRMLSVVPLSDWVVICPGKLSVNCAKFIDILTEVSGKMGFNIGQPQVKELPNENTNSYVAALTEVLDRHNPQLVFCAVMNNKGDRYSAIKKKCCVDRAVPSQVIIAKNLSHPKGVASIATKVGIQMNCKIGGGPWTVDIPVSGLMVVGFDVCHDTTNKALSYGAMVATLDKNMTRYFSSVSAHKSGEELSNCVALDVVKALHKFKELNNTLPSRIFIYRDGVGEGQLPYVFSHEVEKLKEELGRVYGGPTFKLTFIVVTKRINTRIFNDRRGNPGAGTVVDDVITDPDKYDFFLIPQSVRQGSVSVTGYNVLCDTSGWGPSIIQRLSYKLCHMYFNWSGSVRVPAPCQYAHKLAFLIGQSVHKEPSAGLEDKLYFL